MRQRTQLKLAAGLLAFVILLLGVLLLVVLAGRQKSRDALLASLGTQATAVAAQVIPADPWAGREADAIAQVQARSVVSPDGTSHTILARVDSGLLSQNLQFFQELGIASGVWTGRRIQSTAVYEVRYLLTYHGLDFGPRWLVQLDPDGLRPEGSDGLLATNALAKLLENADPSTLWRYFNRSEEVLTALTEHRFDSGMRLAASLLIYFQGRLGEQSELDVIGWAILPEDIDPQGEMVYRAVFQWREGDRVEDAIWQVSYQGGQPTFRPRDRRADEIMALGAQTQATDVLDIRPMSMREEMNPRTEPDNCRRALRFLLADTRIVEAVGAVLAHRARTTALEYLNWHVDVLAEDPARCTVEYNYSQAGEQRAVAWQVAHSTGERYPVDEIARVAERAVRIQVSAPPTAPVAP